MARRVALALIAVVILITTGMSAANADSVSIPKLGVNAPIVGVGAKGGALVLGSDLWAVYTWNQGVNPCQPGSSFLTAHAYEGGEALGNRFGALQRGDRIHITRPGRDCSYRVTTNTVVAKSDVPRNCYSFDGSATGCLVTCVNKIGPGNYTHRRVVRFTLIRR